MGAKEAQAGSEKKHGREANTLASVRARQDSARLDGRGQGERRWEEWSRENKHRTVPFSRVRGGRAVQRVLGCWRRRWRAWERSAQAAVAASGWVVVCSGCQVRGGCGAERASGPGTRLQCCSPVVVGAAERDERCSPRIGRVVVMLLHRAVLCCAVLLQRGRAGAFARENSGDLVYSP